MTDINAIIAENERRKALASAPYDPLTGKDASGRDAARFSWVRKRGFPRICPTLRA